MGRAAVQTGLGADLAHAQFLMIEAEAVENLRGPVDNMNSVTPRSSFRRPLKRFICACCCRIFFLSHIARPRFAMLVKDVHSVNN